MDGATWDRIQALFHAASERPEAEWRPFLHASTGGDEQLAADVLALLEEDARGASILDRGVADAASNVLDSGSPDFAGREFGPYHLIKLLGEGGMGVVYLAERKGLGTPVALKILRDSWLSPARRARFATEQRALAQLNHSSIARLYHAEALRDGTPWFAMEYVEGVPLTDYCREHRSTIHERLELFRSVCEAVQHAHGHAIIHRDLKPSNILVKPDGSVKLLDFGIAKQLETLDETADRTRTGLHLMTPAYAAPEQIRGDAVGVYTDVYSLGVVLYELLTGTLPFDLASRSSGEAERMILNHTPEKPSVASKTAHRSEAQWADVDGLCLTAMHRDPERRYRSAEALIRDIDHYLSGEPLEARPDSLRYRMGKFVRRHRNAVVAAVAAFVILVGIVTYFTVRLAKARNEALAEAARTQRIQRFTVDLFAGGDKDAGPAENLRVLTLLERGEQEARTLAAEPAMQADLNATLGGIYQKLGDFTRADNLMQAALDQRRAVFGPDHADVARSLVELGLLRVDQARLEEAEQAVRQGLTMSKRHLPPRDLFVAKATTALGRVLEERGRYDEAIQILDESVRLQSAPDAATPEFAASLAELANAHFYAGHHDIAESLNQRVLVMHGRLYGPKHPLVAEDLVNLGAIRSELGRYAEAERFYRRALEITQGWYGKEHNRTASNLTMIGRAALFQDHFDDAETLLQQALAIQERVYGPIHPRVASALNELGSVALKRKRLDEAEARYLRIGAIYRSVYGGRHYLNGIAAANLASVFMERKQFSQAESSFRDAVRVFTEALSPNDLNTGIARIKLGRCLLRQQRFKEAEPETLAGYGILSRHAAPSVSFLKAARKDLTEEYDALKQPERAAYYRAEQAKVDQTPPAAAK